MINFVEYLSAEALRRQSNNTKALKAAELHKEKHLTFQIFKYSRFIQISPCPLWLNSCNLHD